MQRILEASQRRIASEKKGLQEAEALAKRRMDDQKRLDEQMAMRQAEQKAEVARRRAGNLEKQLEREAMHTQVRVPTTWAIARHDGPDHLGL